MKHPYRRRDFLKTAAAGTLGLGVAARGATAAEGAGRPAPAPDAPVAPGAAPLDEVRIGMVGVGHQGMSHLRNFLSIEGAVVSAVCDPVGEKVAEGRRLARGAGQADPAGYDGGPEDFRRMCDEEDLDLVFTATPWRFHAPVCLAAMESGKHAATEVPMAVTIDDLWSLVEAAERTGRHCVMMENVCYGRTEMALFRMVRAGLFGELLHAECGYLHDLRELKLTDFYEDRWRVEHSVRRNGDLYPTHGVGPVAQWLGINRGNRFDTLVSMASKSRGLNLWAADHVGADSFEARRDYALGDVVTSLIRTRNGQTVIVTHDTDSPRPYSRKTLVQGTRGLARMYPEGRVHVEGRSPAHQWEDLDAYREEFDHPLWAALEERSAGAGHGGMDWIEDYRLVQALLHGRPTDQDVYDGATWSAVSELSERSVAGGSAPVEFPDFTRGRWAQRPPIDVDAMVVEG